MEPEQHSSTKERTNLKRQMQLQHKIQKHVLTLTISNEKNYSVSSEISDLCEISDLLLFVSYFAFQSEEIKFDDHLFDVCCVN